MRPISRNKIGHNLFNREKREKKIKKKKEIKNKLVKLQLVKQVGKNQISNRTDIQDTNILKICLLQFQQRDKWNWRSSYGQSCLLEKSLSTRLPYPCLSQE